MPAVSTGFSGSDAASFSVQGNGCLQGLQAGESCLISVLFAPTRTGNLAGTLTLESEAGTRDLALSGTAVAPGLLGVEPSAVAFDGVDIGSAASTTLIVTNGGDTATGTITASLATTSSSAFSVMSGTCSRPLLGGQSCALSVWFTPLPPGGLPHSGAVRVSSTPGGTLEVPVTGASNTAAGLSITANESTDFGDVGINGSSSRGFELVNTGDSDAGTLLGIELGAGFSLAPGSGDECVPSATRLDARASCAFRVLFQPTTVGSHAFTMSATTSLGASASLFISGAAVAPPLLVSSASELSFAEAVSVTARGSETLVWTVSNAGGSSTGNLVSSFSNPEIPVFSNTCVGSLAPGGQCELMFQLAPVAEGVRTSILTVSAGSQSTSVTVTGIGN